ncbi:hypothetical protein KSP39_PZI008202 [Platanthera zijinensis]|uniref:Uncharacterized protein n=1 Tax=Platanthera zijinensis TaxID=2320716 RepID=A0AAP0BQE9_9ASPA
MTGFDFLSLPDTRISPVRHGSDNHESDDYELHLSSYSYLVVIITVVMSNTHFYNDCLFVHTHGHTNTVPNGSKSSYIVEEMEASCGGNGDKKRGILWWRWRSKMNVLTNPTTAPVRM